MHIKKCRLAWRGLPSYSKQSKQAILGIPTPPPPDYPPCSSSSSSSHLLLISFSLLCCCCCYCWFFKSFVAFELGVVYTCFFRFLRSQTASDNCKSGRKTNGERARETKRERSRASNKSDDDAVTAAALQRVLGSMKRGRGLRPEFWHVDLDKGP